MKKNLSKIALVAALLMIALFCLTACGSNENKDTKPAEAPASAEATEAPAAAASGDKYVFEGSDMVIKKDAMPENYVFVPDEKFIAAFKMLVVDKTLDTNSTYEDFVKAFGDDGIKMAGMARDGYGYYSWYSDKDAGSDGKVGILVTFKDNGGKLTYYAWTSSTITPQDVQ